MKKSARSGASGRVEARYQARRDQILDIAVEAFRQKGYAGTSMQDIGHALERTKGSLYYYFPDKEEILFQCHERALDHILGIAAEVRDRHERPDAALRELIEKHVEIMVHEFHGTALALEIGDLTGERLSRVVQRRDRYERHLRELLREGVRAGVFRLVDAKLTTFAILGAINWVAQWYREAGGAQAREIGAAFADLFLQGLSPKGRRPARRPASATRTT